MDAPDDGAAGNRNLSMKLSERVKPCPTFAGALFSLCGFLFFLFTVIYASHLNTVERDYRTKGDTNEK